MIVFLVNAYGEQIRVQLGRAVQARVVDVALADGWAVLKVAG